MKKEGVLLGILFIFLLIGINFTTALLPGEFEAIENGYDCLKDTIDSRTCNRLSFEEQIFSLLSVGKCKDQVLARALGDNECWPKENCDLKQTALVTLALEKLNIDTNNSEQWMLNQEGVPTNIDWFLEIESDEATTCSISHESRTYSAQIKADKTVSIDNVECLTPSTSLGSYWFEIKKECYDKTFTISCDEDFLTTLLFKKPDSSTIYVLDEVHPSLAEGTTVEEINSACLKKGLFCDYEGSLWASLTLDFLNHDVSSFIPYLLTGKLENPSFLPDSFLYYLTNGLEFRTDLLSKQINQQYWKVGTDKFYDTPLALLPFQVQFVQEKDNSKEWLIDVQDQSGCWNNDHVRDTAFILYSIWPEEGITPPGPTCIELGYECILNSAECTGNILGYECEAGSVCCDSTANNQSNQTITCESAGYECVLNSTSCDGTILDYNCSTGVCCDVDITGGDDDDNCEDEGFYCMSPVSCSQSGGDFLPDLDCPGQTQCCSVDEIEETCNSLNGIICNANQYCSQGEMFYTNEIAFGEQCCVGGSCELLQNGDDPEEDEYTCEINFGTCEQYECDSGYSESYEYTCQYGDLCCVQDIDSPGENKSYWWVWLLFILIVLITLGILYKDKIQEYLLNMKNKGKDKDSGRGVSSGFPPSYPRRPMMRTPNQRRILPPQGKPRERNI